MPAIQLPSLSVDPRDDRPRQVEHDRSRAERILEAEHAALLADNEASPVESDSILEEVEAALSEYRRMDGPERRLAAILFTDLVGATELTARIGDRDWCDLLAAHHAAVRRELVRYRGREIDTAGDGFLATFDSPSQAIRAACAVAGAVESLGLEIRAGLHAGEIVPMGESIAGIAVHIAARVMALARPGEVLVSSTVRDLVAGSGLRFGSRARRRLKGVPGLWRVFAVERGEVR